MKRRRRRNRGDLRRDVPAYQHGRDSDGESNVDGESSWIYLRRFERDQSLRGRIWQTCCGCNLQHLFTFEVVHPPEGWWLIKRAYGYDPPKKGKVKA